MPKTVSDRPTRNLKHEARPSLYHSRFAHFPMLRSGETSGGKPPRHETHHLHQNSLVLRRSPLIVCDSSSHARESMTMTMGHTVGCERPIHPTVSNMHQGVDFLFPRRPCPARTSDAMHEERGSWLSVIAILRRLGPAKMCASRPKISCSVHFASLATLFRRVMCLHCSPRCQLS